MPRSCRLRHCNSNQFWRAQPTASLLRPRISTLRMQIATPGPEGWPPAALEAKPDILVVSKSFDSRTEELARKMKDKGVRVAVDFCDDHFAHPQIGPHFRALASLADVVVASTPAMGDAVRAATDRFPAADFEPVDRPAAAAAGQEASARANRSRRYLPLAVKQARRA